MGTYSFIDVAASIVGPGGNVQLNGDQGVAEEGITIEYDDDKASMQRGADGSGQHSLHAWSGGSVTIRLLKTSPVNAMLNQMYRYQVGSAANYGQNTISLRDPIRGDNIVATECGFRRHAPMVYAKDGNTIEWVFNAIKIAPILGDGQPISTINQTGNATV